MTTLLSSLQSCTTTTRGLLVLVLVLLSAAPSVGSVLFRTVDDYVLRYHVIDVPVNSRQEALTACQEQGYPYLASIPNNTVNQILIKLVENAKLGRFYLSGLRIGKFVDNNKTVFRWQGGLSDGKRVPMRDAPYINDTNNNVDSPNYKQPENWGRGYGGQPDNSNGCNKEEGQQAVTMLKAGDWDDEVIDNIKCSGLDTGALCEKFATDTMSLTLTNTVNIITSTPTFTPTHNVITATPSMSSSMSGSAANESGTSSLNMTNTHTIVPTSSSTHSHSHSGSFSRRSLSYSYSGSNPLTRSATMAATPSLGHTTTLSPVSSTTMTLTPPTTTTTTTEEEVHNRANLDAPTAPEDSKGLCVFLCIVLPILLAILVLIICCCNIWWFLAWRRNNNAATTSSSSSSSGGKKLETDPVGAANNNNNNKAVDEFSGVLGGQQAPDSNNPLEPSSQGNTYTYTEPDGTTVIAMDEYVTEANGQDYYH